MGTDPGKHGFLVRALVHRLHSTGLPRSVTLVTSVRSCHSGPPRGPRVVTVTLHSAPVLCCQCNCASPARARPAGAASGSARRGPGRGHFISTWGKAEGASTTPPARRGATAGTGPGPRTPGATASEGRTTRMLAEAAGKSDSDRDSDLR